MSASFSLTASMVSPVSGSIATMSAIAGRIGKPSMQLPNFCASNSAVSKADTMSAPCSVGTRMLFMTRAPHVPVAPIILPRRRAAKFGRRRRIVRVGRLDGEWPPG